MEDSTETHLLENASVDHHSIFLCQHTLYLDLARKFLEVVNVNKRITLSEELGRRIRNEGSDDRICGFVPKEEDRGSLDELGWPRWVRSNTEITKRFHRTVFIGDLLGWKAVR